MSDGWKKSLTALATLGALSACSTWFIRAPERVSIGNRGEDPDDASVLNAVSGDGRYVVFVSYATNLVEGVKEPSENVFVRDRALGTTRAVTRNRNPQVSFTDVTISSSGRFLAFTSDGSELVPGDGNGVSDVFVYDLESGTTERVSLGRSGEADGASSTPALSAQGDRVAFASEATNLVEGDTNGAADVFVYDRGSGLTRRVSVGERGAQAEVPANDSTLAVPAISGDGETVAFVSAASNLVEGDTNRVPDVFVHDLASGRTERVSLGVDGAQADGASLVAKLSSDGRWVAFSSLARNIVTDDRNQVLDVFLHDRESGQTRRVSVGANGAEANAACSLWGMSADANVIAFTSAASNLVPRDRNGTVDVFIRNLALSTTTRVSVGRGGSEADSQSPIAALSADGKVVTFTSLASNLVKDDANATYDVFARFR